MRKEERGGERNILRPLTFEGHVLMHGHVCVQGREEGVREEGVSLIGAHILCQQQEAAVYLDTNKFFMREGVYMLREILHVGLYQKKIYKNKSIRAQIIWLLHTPTIMLHPAGTPMMAARDHMPPGELSHWPSV